MDLETEIEAEFMLRHVNSRWLSLKKVLKRIIEQWENLKKYFLEFLPKEEKRFAKDIEPTERYQRIRTILNSKTSKLYIYFAIYIADCLEAFIIPFQCSKPMVHVMYTSIGDLFSKLMGNFVKPKVLMTSDNVKKDAHQLGIIDLTKAEDLLSIHKIEVGSEALYQIGLLENEINLDVIKTEFKMAYIQLTSDLQNNLPHDNTVLKNLQYIHPKNVRDRNAAPAIRMLVSTIATTLKGSKFTALSVER